MLIKCSCSIYVYIYDIKLSDLHFIIISDLDHFLNTGYTMNLTIIMVILFSMTLQLINYNNYRNGIKPTDLRVFQMISGFIAPKNIKINELQLIHKISILCNKHFYYSKIIVNLATFISFAFIFNILISVIEFKFISFIFVIFISVVNDPQHRDLLMVDDYTTHPAN